MFKIALTGGPCAGKSTLLAMLGIRGYSVAPEAATMIIERGELHPVGETRPLFQRAMVALQYELESDLVPSDLPAFMDRGLYDGLAYSLVLGEKVPSVFQDLPKGRYDIAFVLDPLPVWTDDGVRYEDVEFAERITPVIEQVYRDHGVPTVRVPVMPKEFRLKLILDTVKRFLLQKVADTRRLLEVAQEVLEECMACAEEALSSYAGVGKSVCLLGCPEPGSDMAGQAEYLKTKLAEEGFTVVCSSTDSSAAVAGSAPRVGLHTTSSEGNAKQRAIEVRRKMRAIRHLMLDDATAFVLMPGGRQTLKDLTTILSLENRNPRPTYLIGKQFWSKAASFLLEGHWQPYINSQELGFEISDDIDAVVADILAKAQQK